MAQGKRKPQSVRERSTLPRKRAKRVEDKATEIREDGDMRTGQTVGACQERLSASGFLSGLSPVAASTFDSIKVTTTYPGGAVLFVEGEKPHGVFVLSSGRVKLSICSANGKMMILRIAKPGEILGLHAVVSNAGFQATAETIEACQVSFVRSDEFLRLLREHPQASLGAARQLSASYQEACEQLRAIGLCDSARKKVARFVLEWVEGGEMQGDGIHATLTITHEEIGQLIGTSRETITRALGDFKSRRWISIKGSLLLVKNVDALQAMVGSDMHSSWSGVAPQAGMNAGERNYMGLHSPVRSRETVPYAAARKGNAETR
jgi:CRP/FNR family transcriptional regulator, cyclic AMP receptor protein